jgi:hypothetical protein
VRFARRRKDMNNYIRLYTDWDANPKIGKLYMYYRTDGILGLLALWAYAAERRSDGVLTGLSNFDIMIAAGLPSDGRFDSFAQALVRLGLLDYDGETYSIHDWDEHNPHLMESLAEEERDRRAEEE